MWRARLASACDWLVARSLAGTDSWGNKYYTQAVKGRADRRYVEFRDGSPSPETMPVQWWAWLHGRRDAPPSPAELARAEADQEALAARVAVLCAEDAKERLRGLGDRTPGPPSPEDASVKHEMHSASRAERQRVAMLQLASAQKDAARTDRPAYTRPGSAGDRQASWPMSTDAPTV
jgi:NADH:ubiquinone oxidoreductase subunit